jgi:hypothetical protein
LCADLNAEVAYLLLDYMLARIAGGERFCLDT